MEKCRKLTWLKIESHPSPLYYFSKRKKFRFFISKKKRWEISNSVRMESNHLPTGISLLITFFIRCVQDFKGLWEIKFKFYKPKIKWTILGKSPFNLKGRRKSITKSILLFRTFLLPKNFRLQYKTSWTKTYNL